MAPLHGELRCLDATHHGSVSGSADLRSAQTLAFVRAYPDRLVGIASVDLSRPMVGIRELRRAVRELGFRGSTYSALVVEPAPDDRRFYALYASRDTLDSPGLQKRSHWLRNTQTSISTPQYIKISNAPISQGTGRIRAGSRWAKSALWLQLSGMASKVLLGGLGDVGARWRNRKAVPL